MGFLKPLLPYFLVPVLALAQIPKPISTDDLLAMKQAGLDDQTILKAIETNGTAVDTSASGLIRLKNAGVSDTVIKASLTAPNGRTGATKINSLPSTSVPEPEYNSIVWYIETPNTTLKPLEKQVPNTAAKVKALGFGGATSAIVFEGSRASTRFLVGQNVQFILRGIPEGTDPAAFVNLDSLTISKQRRTLTTAKIGIFSGAKTEAGKTTRVLVFNQYGEHSVAFTPSLRLEPGEYVITCKGGTNAFLFGVD